MEVKVDFACAIICPLVIGELPVDVTKITIVLSQLLVRDTMKERVDSEEQNRVKVVKDIKCSLRFVLFFMIFVLVILEATAVVEVLFFNHVILSFLTALK